MFLQNFRKINDPDINKWLDLADLINNDLIRFDKAGIVNKQNFFEAGRNICDAYLKKTPFTNPFRDTEAAGTFDELMKMIHILFQNEESARVLIPMSFEMVKDGDEPYDTVLRYVVEGICIAVAQSKNLEYQEEDNNEKNDITKRINELVAKSNKYARDQKYEDAIAIIDSLLKEIDEFSENKLLFVDKATIMNNKAYFLFCVGRLDEALVTVDNALKTYPDIAIVHYTKAEILNGKDMLKDAVASIDKAIDLEYSEDKIQFKNSILSKM